jgi:hypothetical protein
VGGAWDSADVCGVAAGNFVGDTTKAGGKTVGIEQKEQTGGKQ